MRLRRVLFWAPIAVTTLIVALFALRFGWIASNMSEGDVILAYASRYVAEQRAANPASPAVETDCVATPGAARGIWLVISCGADPCNDATYRAYYVNRIGSLIHETDNACPDAMIRQRAA